MPEGLSAALALDGLPWLIAAITVSGLVRGFAGFGTGLIFVPVAGQYLPPAQLVFLMTITGLFSSAALVPRAWGQAAKGEIVWMILPALVTLPIGLWLLTQVDVLAVRWTVAIAASITLIALVSGVRYARVIGPRGLATIGGGAGVLGGLTGLTGPVVILFYLASPRGPQAIRANTILFLAALDLVSASALWWSGMGEVATLWLVLLLVGPYFVTTLIGQVLFRPEAETVYRWVAYSVIAMAVLTGVPLFD